MSFDAARSAGRRFELQLKYMSVGDDAWIEDDRGERAYKVDGKALRILDTFILRDPDSIEVAKIEEPTQTVRDAATIARESARLATVRKTRTGLRHDFEIDVDEDGAQMHAHGHLSYHEYEINRDGAVIATVSKRWSRLTDTYGVELRAGEDEALLLTLTVALGELARH